MCPTQEQMLINITREIDNNIVIVGDFNIPPIDESSRKKINKETTALNDTLNQMDLIDIFRAFHLKAAEYTSISSAHGTFFKIDHMLGHKRNLNKFM